MHSFKKFAFFRQNEKFIIISLVVFLCLNGLLYLYRIKKKKSINTAFYQHEIEKFKRELDNKLKEIDTENSQAKSNDIIKLNLSLDLNTATKAEFEKIPGIGPVFAQRIVEYRKKHNGYRSIDELINIKGIGEKRLTEIKPYLKIVN